jgi:tetratricopeptide (TPR) repeat protein
MKNYFLIFSLIASITLSAQKVKTDMTPMTCVFMPKIIVPSDNLTYSCVAIEHQANEQYRTTQMNEGTNWNTATLNLIAGLKNVGAAQNPAIAVTIRTEPYSIASKSQMQSTLPNGNATAGAQFSYALKAHYVLNAIVVQQGDTVLRISRDQGAVTDLNFPNNVKPTGSPANFATAAALDAEYRNNNHDIMVVTRKKCNLEFIAFLSDTLNAMFGYPSAKLYFEIATAKSKSFQYNDLDSAKDYMMQAMDTVTAHAKKNDHSNWSIESSRVLVRKAVSIWEKALTEESVDKKARIHPELAGYIRLNLALAYMMLDDYAKADELYSKCFVDPELGNGSQRNIDFIRKKYLPVFKARYEIHKGRLQ